MRIVPWLRPPLRFALWRLLHVLDFGIRPWFCMMVLGVDVSSTLDVFSGGWGFAVWWGCLKPGWCLNHLLSTGHMPSVPASPAALHLNCVSLQPSPSRAAKKMACKATGNTRQPCLWVQCVMQCCLHWTDWCLWGRHLSVLPVVSAIAAAEGITEDPISPVKVLNVLKGL